MGSKISIQNTIDSNISKVWNYWNQPQHITHWNFASPDWHCPKATNDLRVGGILHTRMEAKDGSFGFDFEGVYDEIIGEKKIRYSLDDGRMVTTTFEDLDGKTKITTVFDTETENPVEIQRAGWQAILDNFKKYTEKN